MFCKTSVGHEHGCVTGALGPARVPLPAIGVAVEDDSARRWKLARLSADVMILVDCFAESDTPSKDAWSQVLKHMHGVLLRRLGKKRVVYLIRQALEKSSAGGGGGVGRSSQQQEGCWHSNVNLVTGVSERWLDEAFSLGRTERSCLVAGVGQCGQ